MTDVGVLPGRSTAVLNWVPDADRGDLQRRQRKSAGRIAPSRRFVGHELGLRRLSRPARSPPVAVSPSRRDRPRGASPTPTIRVPVRPGRYAFPGGNDGTRTCPAVPRRRLPAVCVAVLGLPLFRAVAAGRFTFNATLTAQLPPDRPARPARPLPSPDTPRWQAPVPIRSLPTVPAVLLQPWVCCHPAPLPRTSRGRRRPPARSNWWIFAFGIVEAGSEPTGRPLSSPLSPATASYRHPTGA